MDEARFRHTALAHPQNIRLLRINRFESDVPVVDIFEFSLGKAPNYKALSYTWGTPQSGCYVVCNGLPLAVTPNCRAALARLWRFEGCSLIWIDAICIDQASNGEKSSQVPLMGDIYSQAEEVVIWLGEASFESEVAIEHLRSAAAIATEARMNEDKFKALNDDFIDVCKALYRGRHSTRNTNPVKEILGRPWFNRVWTFQEAVLARKATLVCGDAELSWQELEKGLFSLADYSPKLHSRALPWSNYHSLRKDLISFRLIKMLLSHPESISARSSTVPSRNTIRKWWNELIGSTTESPPEPRDLTFHEFIATNAGARQLSSAPASLLQRCCLTLVSIRARAVTDPRDKVYGVYGLLQKTGFRNLPKVDYTISVEELYTSMTRFVIEQDQSLLVLSAVSGFERTFKFPSWVPDWNFRCTFFPISAGFDASKSSSALFSFDEHARATFRGIIVDEIGIVAKQSTLTYYEMNNGTVISEDKSSVNLVSAIQLVSAFQEWIRLAHLFPSDAKSYPGGETVENAFCRTLICDGRGILEDQLEETSVIFRSFREWTVMMTANDTQYGVGMPLLCSVMEKWSNTPTVKEYYRSDLELDVNPDTASEEVTIVRAIHSSDACHFHELAGTYAAQRVFCTTKGSRFALAPLHCQPGDTVVLLAGANCPCVVRRQGAAWRLLGFAYVHGLMHGEFWPEDTTQLSSFVFI